MAAKINCIRVRASVRACEHPHFADVTNQLSYEVREGKHLKISRRMFQPPAIRHAVHAPRAPKSSRKKGTPYLAPSRGRWSAQNGVQSALTSPDAQIPRAINYNGVISVLTTTAR